MIQRKQTLYLLLAAICYILVFVFPVYQIYDGEGNTIGSMMVHKINFAGEDSADSLMLYLPMILSLILIIGALVDIFLFKKRQLQAKISQFLLLLGSALLVSLFFSLERISHEIKITATHSSQYTLWAALLALPLIFFYLANKGILADERLVQEADRLR